MNEKFFSDKLPQSRGVDDIDQDIGLINKNPNLLEKNENEKSKDMENIKDKENLPLPEDDQDIGLINKNENLLEKDESEKSKDMENIKDREDLPSQEEIIQIRNEMSSSNLNAGIDWASKIEKLKEFDQWLKEHGEESYPFTLAEDFDALFGMIEESGEIIMADKSYKADFLIVKIKEIVEKKKNGEDVDALIDTITRKRKLRETVTNLLEKEIK